jgi:hypothetical protein
LEEINSYQLLEDHPLWRPLEKIFSKGDVLEDGKTFAKAGFITLHHQPSGMRVARHPLLPEYLVKVYLNDAPPKEEFKWAINRCKGVDNIRNLITEHKLRHLVVPEKKIYYPPYSNPILVVEDMRIVSYKESKIAWKNASKREVQELYILLKSGFGSCFLAGNIPYTQFGKFACIDTAFPYRKHEYTSAKKYLSEKGKRYFNQIEKRDIKK